MLLLLLLQMFHIMKYDLRQFHSYITNSCCNICNGLCARPNVICSHRPVLLVMMVIALVRAIVRDNINCIGDVEHIACARCYNKTL